MKKAKSLCLIRAFLMIFGSVMSAQAAENNFFDTVLAIIQEVTRQIVE